MTLDESLAEVGAFCDRYLGIFAAWGRGDRDDVEALLGFHHVPLTVAAASAVTTLPTQEAVLGLARNLITQLRQNDYADSATHRFEARPLHARAVWMEGEFSRQNRGGETFERFDVAYLAFKPEADWRIAAIVPMPA